MKDFGAKCDGSSDDSAAINTATNKAWTQGGGEVVLPYGTCVANGIELFKGVTLRGQGVGATTLLGKPGLASSDYTTDRSGHAAAGVLIVYTSYPSGGYNGNAYLDGVGLRDLTVDCNYAASPGIDTWGVYLNGTVNARVTNVVAKNCGSHGFTFKETSFGIFRYLRGDSNGLRAAGDGLVLLSRSSDNLVADSSFANNASAGVEDEGRFGAYNPLNRNVRNRFERLTVTGAGDNGVDAVFSDYSQWTDITVIGGVRSPNSACHQFVGTTNAFVDGFRCDSPAKEGMRVWSEVFGADGVNSSLTVRRAEFTNTSLRAVVLEGLQGGSIQATIRGVGGGNAVSMSAIGYGRTGGNAACSSGGYGRGTYTVGQAYRASPSCYGYGTFVQSGGSIYELTSAFTGTGLSVTAPTCGTIGCTSADNGGLWTNRGAVGSTDVVLDLDYDGSVGAQATYGLYAYNPTNLTLGGRILNAATNAVWIDGTPAGVSGLRIENAILSKAGGRTLNISAGILTGSNSYVLGGDLSGGGAAMNLNTFAGQLTVTDALGWPGNP